MKANDRGTITVKAKVTDRAGWMGDRGPRIRNWTVARTTK